jgi:hypothetical protein
MAEVAFLQFQSEIKVTLFLFASRPFLSNNLRFILKLIDKATVVVVGFITTYRISTYHH